MNRILFNTQSLSKNLIALLVRAITGTLFFYHGILKMLNYQEYLSFFPDPIGLGTQLSLILAMGSEMLGGILVTIGLFTRLSLIPLFVTISVAFFVAHAGAPFEAKELAFVYWLLCILSFTTGPGKFSIDHMIVNRTGK